MCFPKNINKENIAFIRIGLLFILASLVKPSIAQTPVPVVNEPFHKVIFSNDYVRIIEVQIPPGDTTRYHIHKTNSAIVFLSRNTTGSQPLGGKVSIGQAYPGNTSYATFGDTPVTHRVWNQDTAFYHVLDIELISHPRDKVDPVLESPGLTLAWDKPEARAYKLHLDPGMVCSIKGNAHPHLLIRISGRAEPFREAGGPNSKIRPINFLWYPAGTGFEFSSKGPLGVQCVLLELN
jgi:hypothetical protein